MAFDAATFQARLKSLLPAGWFAQSAPNLDSLLGGLSTTWSWLSDLLDFAQQQMRISTASSNWLDLAANDFFGPEVIRRQNEGDDTFRARISKNLLLSAATRPALIDDIAALTGFAATVFEPSRCGDTGAYGAQATDGTVVPCGFAYGQTGGWGSLNLPCQFFVTISTQPRQGDAMPTGYGDAGGGYSAGSTFYNSMGSIQSQITDLEVSRIIQRLLPINATAWVRFH